MLKNKIMRPALSVCFCISILLLISSCRTPVHKIELSRMVDGLNLAERDVTESYIYILARYLVIRQEHIDMSRKGASYNKIQVNELDSADVVNPNLDVVILESWLSLDPRKPVLLNIPEIQERYYTVQLSDEWAEITMNINERNFPEHPNGTFALCIDGTYPEIPGGAMRIDLPSHKAKLLARIERKNSDKEALKLAKMFTVTQTGKSTPSKPVEIPMFTNNQLLGVEIFDKPMITDVMASAQDISGNQEEYKDKILAISDYITKSAKNRQLINMIIRDKSIPKLFWYTLNFGDKRWGWISTASFLKFGDDIWFRCAANLGDIWWNSSSETANFVGKKDMDGNRLNGKDTYLLHYSKKNLPQKHVDGYWSLTLVSLPDYRVVPNKLSRYHLGQTSDLSYERNGSLKIYLAPELPPGVPESNWLPTPTGKSYSLNHRFYVPKDEVLSGKWYAAPIQKIANP